MFLREVGDRRRWHQLGEVYTWLAFIATVLVVTNCAASLDKMYAYNFQPLSVLLSFGWILLCELVEALGMAVLVELLIILATVWFNLDLSLVIRFLLLVGLVLALAFMVMILFI